MSERPSHVPLTPDLPADTRHRAEQTVLRRARDQHWTRTEVRQVMEILGFLPYDDGARTDSNGFRAPLTAGERRRRAQTDNEGCA